MRPLDRVRSIKVKLGLVIVGAIGATFFVNEVGYMIGVAPRFRVVIAFAVGLVLVQLLAHGMTFPLREMVKATARMAEGDYSSRVTATAHDEVGQLARAFNDMAEQLAITDGLRRELVANVSHELRTPVTGLQATLENLVDGVGRPDQPTLTSMLSEVERLGRLITQLLDLSQLESGAAPVSRVRFSLEPLIKTVVSEVSAFRGAQISIDSPGAIIAWGDPERIYQVVRNLLDNAVAHTPSDKPIVVVLRENTTSITIEVVDQGVGIPTDDLDRVFDRFVRVDTGRSQEHGGTGLGLSIVRWIVELHGGNVSARHNDPVGTRIIVHLPKEIQ